MKLGRLQYFILKLLPDVHDQFILEVHKTVLFAHCLSVLVNTCLCCCSSSVSSDATTTWRGVVESSDCVGLFNSTFTVSCVDRNTAATRTAKVARTGQLLLHAVSQ